MQEGSRWGRRWLGFLAANTIVALLFEAIPEEVAIRGYALTALAFTAGWALNLTVDGTAFVPAPEGQDAASYYVMLAAFGLMLTYARDATISATVWTCIGAHVAWLTVPNHPRRCCGSWLQERRPRSSPLTRRSPSSRLRCMQPE